MKAEEPRPREEGRLLAGMNGQTLCSPIRTFKLQCFLLFSQRLPTLGTSLHGPDWVLGASILPLGGAQGECLTDRPSRLLRMGERVNSLMGNQGAFTPKGGKACMTGHSKDPWHADFRLHC